MNLHSSLGHRVVLKLWGASPVSPSCDVTSIHLYVWFPKWGANVPSLMKPNLGFGDQVVVNLPPCGGRWSSYHCTTGIMAAYINSGGVSLLPPSVWGSVVLGTLQAPDVDDRQRRLRPSTSSAGCRCCYGSER